MSTLKVKAQSILDEKNNKIIPENIKAGIQIFNVTGTLEEGINTNDATATANDIALGKTAYINGTKVTGALDELTDGSGTDFSVGNMTNSPNMSILRVKGVNESSDRIMRIGSEAVLWINYSDIASAINLDSNQIIEGNTILGITGTGETGIDTSDATATSMDLPLGVTAYARGEKITGVLNKYENTTLMQVYGGYANQGSAVEIKSIPHEGNPSLHGEGVIVSIMVPKEENGLVAENIVEGVNIFGVEGTATVGVDTSDATATEYDIAPGVTAYTADGLVHGRMNVAEGMSYDSEYSKDKTEYRMFYDESDHKVKMIFRDDIKVLLVEGTEIETRMLASDIAQAIGLTSNQIVKGNTVLDIEGTYQPSAVTFATIEEMNNNTAYPENTFAVVYGTEYVGTYKLDSGAWTQIGDATDSSEMMSVLNSVDGEILEYEGNGGTDDEINAVLDDILTNPNDQGATEDPGL